MELQEKIDQILKLMGRKTGITHIQILHDDGCPALETRRLQDCTCNPEIRKMRFDA
jgi:hypothetical protein